MRYDIITIFPKIFDSYFGESIIKRAEENKLIKIEIHNLRDFSIDKHKKVDDKAYGGGPGMVMQIQPFVRAVEFAKLKVKPARLGHSGGSKKLKVIIFTPAGKQFDNKMAAQLAKYNQLILVCGRYEGIDARLSKVLRDSDFKVQELSIGPYVLTGGEIPAMVLVDTISRQIPGVLGKRESLEENRFGAGMSTYTRPEVFEYKGKKYKAPKVLLSGNHKAIEEWWKNRS